MAKNTAVRYENLTINIVDTPGHADFGGEVERTLTMVDGVLLLVDASEGPLPQTRFVLRKALERGLPPIVIINKIDRRDARPAEVLSEIYDLFIDSRRARGPDRFPGALCQFEGGHRHPRRRTAGAHAASAVRGDCRARPSAAGRPGAAPAVARRQPGLQRLPVAASRSAASSTARCGSATRWRWPSSTGRSSVPRVTKLFAFDGLQRVEIARAAAGDIVCLAGLSDITIGETITDPEHQSPIPPVQHRRTEPSRWYSGSTRRRWRAATGSS